MDVLDKGFVKLVNSMGSDLAVVASARVSNGITLEEASKGEEADQKLINFLMRNRHGTPFEHSVFTFYVKCPIFVAREWQRHRIGCLVGDTKITCVSPSGKTTYKRTIKEIYDLKHGGVIDDLGEFWYPNGKGKNGNSARTRRRRIKQDRVRVLPNCQERTLRVLDEDTNEFKLGKMKQVWESGAKQVYTLHLESGRSITGTVDHMILTSKGWEKLGSLHKDDLVATDGLVPVNERPIPPSLRAGIGVWTTMMRGRLLRDENCYICGQFFMRDDLVLDHVIPVTKDLLKALDENNLKPACIDCHKLKTNKEQPLRKSQTKLGIVWRKVIWSEAKGEKMTYDIEMEGPHHNYIADGVVVHNSYNEISGRYTEFNPEFYIPSEFRQPGSTNKQGSEPLNDPKANEWLNVGFEKWSQMAYDEYQYLLKQGLAKEMARMVLPLNLYTQYYWTVNARALMNFLNLRAAPEAQWEIQQYALAIKEIFKDKMPQTYKAWEENKYLAP